jgi:hypothetical protein
MRPRLCPRPAIAVLLFVGTSLALAVPATAGAPPPGAPPPAAAAPPGAPRPAAPAGTGAAAATPGTDAAAAGEPSFAVATSTPPTGESRFEREPIPMQLVPEVAPIVRPDRGLIPRLVGLCEPDPCVPAFFRDTDLRLHLRTFYFDRHNPDLTQNQAWAIGGWLQYTSGWLADVFQVGATAYTSQPLYAPEDKDGTSLLAPGQEEITVPFGQAYARARWKDYAVLTAYRQSVNDGYIGPQDNRMIPNTFEGVTLHGELCKVDYQVGYLWEMKPRNRDGFIPMSEQAGVAGSDEGVAFGSLAWHPTDHWEVFVGDYYTPDVFNIAYGYVKHDRRLGHCAKAEMGFQFTDQRSVGDELLGDFATWNAGAGARVVWDWGLTLGAAVHATGSDANIRSPYGTWPGYLSLIETDFNRANEVAFGVGARFAFGKSHRLHVPGLLLVLAYARGFERENPATGASLPDTGELDFDVTYDVPRVKGLQLRFRNAYVDTDGEQVGYQFRFIVNWEVDLW